MLILQNLRKLLTKKLLYCSEMVIEELGFAILCRLFLSSGGLSLSILI